MHADLLVEGTQEVVELENPKRLRHSLAREAETVQERLSLRRGCSGLVSVQESGQKGAQCTGIREGMVLTMIRVCGKEWCGGGKDACEVYARGRREGR